MSGHVRLVKRRGVQHGIDATHGAANGGAVCNGGDDIRERRSKPIKADDVVLAWAKRSHKRLAKVARASGDEDAHPCRPFSVPRSGVGQRAL
jgi:N-acetylmuramoyl-L-alanine amidase